MSSGSPMRLSSVCEITRWRVTSSNEPSSGQAMGPGAKPFTRTSGQHYRESDLVGPASTVLVKQENTLFLSGRSALELVTLTMQPAAFFRYGAAAWDKNRGAFR